MKNKALYSLSLIALIAIGCNQNSVPSSFEFALNELGDAVDFHSEIQLRYIQAEDYLTTMGIASGSSSKEQPLAIELSWEGKANNKKDPNSYAVNVYEGDSSNIYQRFETTENHVDFYNAKINTNYSYEVIAMYPAANKTFVSDSSSFKTTDKGPRNLYVENVMNIRDLGGHGIKQGLIYRSGRFNESDGTTNITDKTIETMTVDLKVKTEIDLRRDDEIGGITSSPLGESVNYHHLPMYYGGNNVLTYVGESSSGSYNNPLQIKEFFHVLSDENNYPIDFHCAIGKDRTGCMAYLIEALCGMDEEYLYRDYLWSNFAKISGMCEITDIDNKYGATLKDYEGTTLQEKTFNYLENVVGVPRSELLNIQSILTENK